MTDHPSALVSVPIEGQSFSCEQDWINRASRVLTAHPEYNNAEHGERKGWRGQHFTALCFDQAGNRMSNGGDFMRATKEQTYPVWWIWPDQIAALLAAAPAATQAAGVGEAIESIIREAILSASVEVPESFPDRTAMRVEIVKNTTAAILSALRAQPPAREDALPVEPDVIVEVVAHEHPTLGNYTSIKGWTNKARLPPGYHNLYTHPAPDAMRVAVEALEQIAYRKGVSNVGLARKTLAALQAEQKGGA